jgi:hypothetical protein
LAAKIKPGACEPPAMRPLLVPVGRGGVSGKVLAVGVAPRAGGAEGVLQLACLRNARSLLRLSDLKRRGLCFGPPRCRLTSSVTRDNLAMSGSANLEKTPWTTRCRRETPTTMMTTRTTIPITTKTRSQRSSENRMNSRCRNYQFFCVSGLYVRVELRWILASAGFHRRARHGVCAATRRYR